jgi:hypothetical protein
MSGTTTAEEPGTGVDEEGEVGMLPEQAAAMNANVSRRTRVTLHVVSGMPDELTARQLPVATAE